MVVYNPYAYETHENPYPIYAELREQAPSYWNDEIGFWALSRHGDVSAAFIDHHRYSNAEGVALDTISMDNPTAVYSFLAMDPPLHDQMRALVSRGFTPRRIAALEPRIRELSRDHIGKFRDMGKCDFIDDFAGKLPMDIVSEMLGVPEPDRDRLRHWSDTVVHREEGINDVPPAALKASMQLLDYYTELVADRRKHLASDLVRADPSLIPRWLEETLRYDNSTQALARTLTCDVELHGQNMRAGDKVFLLVGSANRDPRVFPDPDLYDISRDTSEMLSFGRGVHFCLGAALARLEGRVALEEIQSELPDFEIDEEGLVRVHSINVRGFANMPISF